MYFLDSEKSKVNWFYDTLSGKKFPGHTRPQKLEQKNPKNYQFTANPRLVKIVIVQKSYSLTIFGPLSVRKCQNLAFVGFSESKILRWKKTSQNSRCVFFTKVTVYVTRKK